MFLDLNHVGPVPKPSDPRPIPRMTPMQEKMIRRIIVFNLLMLLVGPLAGASILEIVVFALRR